MSAVETTLFILRGASAVLGAAFFYVTLRAYIRHRTRPMGVLALATALLTLAAITEGAVLRFAGEDALDMAHIIESVVFLVAFGVLLASVLAPSRGRGRKRASDPRAAGRPGQGQGGSEGAGLAAPGPRRPGEGDATDLDEGDRGREAGPSP